MRYLFASLAKRPALITLGESDRELESFSEGFSQAAKLVVDIASGQVEDREPTPEERGVDPAASAMGRKGGPARATSLTPERRAEIARKAAAKRWGGSK